MSNGLTDCDLNNSRPMRLRCGRIDADLLRTLGTGLAAGRESTRADERLNAPPIAIVSYQLWRSRLGGAPAVFGRTIAVDGNPITVVGVLPPDFELPTLDGRTSSFLRHSTIRNRRRVAARSRSPAWAGSSPESARRRPAPRYVLCSSTRWRPCLRTFAKMSPFGYEACGTARFRTPSSLPGCWWRRCSQSF
jgi:MacB-like periplasmic core domain